jgi:hypothetical protein
VRGVAVLADVTPTPTLPHRGGGREKDPALPSRGEGVKRTQPSPIEGRARRGTTPPIIGRAERDRSPSAKRDGVKSPVVRFAHPSPSMGEGWVGVTTADETWLT